MNAVPHSEADPPPADADLVHRLQLGDPRAFDAVVGAHWRRAFAYAMTLLDDRDLANDVAQEAFVRLWRARDTLDPARPVLPWLLRTVRNLCFNERRNLAVRRRWVEREQAAEPPRPRTPLQELEASEVAAAVARAIAGLPSRRREVFTLVHLQKLPYGEVAAVMGIRPQSVANHMQAAIADLRAALAYEFPELSGPDR